MLDGCLFWPSIEETTLNTPPVVTTAFPCSIGVGGCEEDEPIVLAEGQEFTVIVTVQDINDIEDVDYLWFINGPFGIQPNGEVIPTIGNSVVLTLPIYYETALHNRGLTFTVEDSFLAQAPQISWNIIVEGME